MRHAKFRKQLTNVKLLNLQAIDYQQVTNLHKSLITNKLQNFRNLLIVRYLQKLHKLLIIK